MSDGLVWIPHNKEGFVKGGVLSFEDEVAEVKTEGGEIFHVLREQLIPIHGEENLADISNLTEIADLNSASLLQALQERFEYDRIYTFTGQVLIAVNPFKRIKALSTNKILESFMSSESVDHLDPHVYSVAHASFVSMMKHKGRNQSVLVSGESGAGKTETTKIVLNYLTGASSRGKNGQNDVCKAVLQTNELLEAFGNARTVRNDNSSRFGKLIQLQFSPKKFELIGATIDTYLLEKARITHQSPGERNFHIFYELAAGCSETEQAEYLLPELSECIYTNQSGLYTRLDTSDEEQFKRTLNAMEIVGVTAKERKKVFKIVSAVLHLGNILFVKLANSANDSDFSQDEKTTYSVKSVCTLLEVSEQYLRQTLCTRSIATGGKGLMSRVTGVPETVSRAHTIAEAREARDALASTLYHRLFYWIVWKVNLKVGEVGQGDDMRRRLSEKLQKLQDFAAQEKKNKKLKKDTQTYISDYSIGCLDIFGFEVFEFNSFEQLCINYANEVLQQQFNTFVFKDEQKFYKAEGIDWKNIDFPDNMECIRMIEGSKKKVGLLKLIDEECMYPKGSDKSLHAKLQKHLATELDIPKPLKKAKSRNKSQISHLVTNSFSQSRKSGRFTVNNRTQLRQLKFTISHFAGDVEYNVRGFYAKNKDELRREAVGLLRGSKNSIVRILLPVDAMNGPQDSSSAGKYFQEIHERRKRKRGRRGSVLMRGSLERNFNLDVKSNQKIQQITVGKQFKNQLYQAMKHIRSSQPHYVRCLKPNDDTAPGEFDRFRVLEQLNYSGVLEVVRVARAGYSTRFTHAQFLKRFRILASYGDAAVKVPPPNCKRTQVLQEAISRILEGTGLVLGVDYEVGNTITMFRSEGYAKVQVYKRELQLRYIIRLQHWFRFKIFQRKMETFRNSALDIQRVFRGYQARKEYAKYREIILAKRAAEEEKRRFAQEAERQRIEKEKEAERLRLEAEMRRLEDERRIREELEKERLRKEEEARRIAEEKRLKALHEKQEAERIARLKIETEAAVVIQSFVRVILAQNKANTLYNEKVEQEFLINEAANVIIDLFRENLRKKQLARAKELADLEEVERLKKDRALRIKRREKRRREFEQKKKRRVKRQAQAIYNTFDILLAALVPFILMFVLGNRRILMFLLFFGMSLAAGATFTVSANNRKDYLKRKKKKRARSKRTTIFSDELSSDYTMTNRVLFVEGDDTMMTSLRESNPHNNRASVASLGEVPRFPFTTSQKQSFRNVKPRTDSHIRSITKTSVTSRMQNSYPTIPHRRVLSEMEGKTFDIVDESIRSLDQLSEVEIVGARRKPSKSKGISKFFKRGKSKKINKL